MRVGEPAPDRMSLVEVSLVDSTRPIDLVMPASSSELARFQMQRSAGVSGVQKRLMSGDGLRTASIAFAIRENRRKLPFQDRVLTTGTQQSLESVLESADADKESAQAIRAADPTLPAVFPPDSIVALRQDGDGRIAQISIYGPDQHIGTFARSGYSRFSIGTDPWHHVAFRDTMEDGGASAMAPGNIRLIDALYAQALELGLSANVVGELVMALSNSYDLDQKAETGDRLTLLFATRPGQEDLSQVLYVTITRKGGSMPCYVVPFDGNRYACFTPNMIHLGGSTGDAVEALVNQIIKVESAGVATAKNPRSSATGLGQFISSTWLRMIRTYRPDLYASMPRDQVLALRVDPELSRAMVVRLAQENEAFLRARGKPVRPGTLYLAHFLGPQGAVLALSSVPSDSVLSVMGEAVVTANPFLKHMSVADMIAWSDRKMRRSGKNTSIYSVPNSNLYAQYQSIVRTIDQTLEYSN
jgi:hypothetical protein